MEEWEKEIIIKNMTGLVNTTICNLKLLVTLQASGILDDDDFEDLIGLQYNRRKQVVELYTVLQSRVNAFESLLEGLQQTNQAGAVTILITALKQNNRAIDTLTISYDVNTVLGNGSSGTVVYKGKFGERDVAVKKVYLLLFSGAQALHEVKILKDVDAHENIIRYFGAKQTNEFVLIALELCEMSLNQWIENKDNSHGSSTCDKITKLSCMEVLRQITHGLKWLHSKKIVHRDIKPKNVLLLLQLHRVKLSDFGLSRRVNDGESFVATLNAGGTPGWLAPEVLAYFGQENIACKFFYASDVFSLGCVYYYVLTDGKYAFGDPDRCEDNILNGKSVIMESKMMRGCGQNCIITLIQLMISKDFNCRPSCETITSYKLCSEINTTFKCLNNTTQPFCSSEETPKVLESYAHDSHVQRKAIGGVIHAGTSHSIRNTRITEAVDLGFSSGQDNKSSSISSSSGRIELIDITPPDTDEANRDIMLRYDGNNIISNEDGKIILRKACLNLSRKLNNVDNNHRLLLIFENKGILDPLESESIRISLKTITTSAWISQFCTLLENRHKIGEALNLLLNLDADPDLKNYRSIIRNIFITLELPKRI